MKVVKFGGSSLANAEQIQKVFTIVKEDSERKIVVVSAPGKRTDDDEKVTDMLIALAHSHLEDQYDESLLARILKRYEDIVSDLAIQEPVMAQINEHFLNLRNNKKLKGEYLVDAYKASGEDNNAKVIAAYFNEQGVPARYVSPVEAKLYVSDTPGNAHVLPEAYDELSALVDTPEVVIFPGFFGVTPFGKVLTFSRGGSDITGAILANAVEAELYENFTDVDCIYVASPKVVHEPLGIDVLSYREMRELSYAGFSVLHDEALQPAFVKGIPVHVKNTNNPLAKGTYIMRGKGESPSLISGIASSNGFARIYIRKYLMNQEVGFMRRAFSILEEHNVNVEHVPTGIDDITIVIKESELRDLQDDELVAEMYEKLQADEVTITRGLSLVMLVGEGMVQMVGTTARATGALARHSINIEFFNQGSSEISMTFGINEQQEAKAIRALYQTFFGQEQELEVVE